jgi:molybdopterin/thiamine biosynthesis adenylyltransferase
MNFNYKEAFQRNIGLLTEEEQEKISRFTIAIPGMGAVGGAHAIALVRQGFQHFKIADLDVYELKNFNRQYGAKMANIGRAKVEVMREEMLAINPECTIELFRDGINDQNLDEFLSGVDLAVDGIDAFEVDVRRKFTNRSLELNIPLITAGPIGFSVAFLIFMPGGLNFDQYFNIMEKTENLKKLLSFFVGLAPALLQRKYMKKVNIKEKRGPSSAGSVSLCAGVVAIYALKILLKKGIVRAVPYYHQFDVMTDRYVTKKLWFGNKNPIQKLKIALAEKLVKD